MKMQISSIIVLILALSFCTTKSEVDSVNKKGKDVQSKILKLPNSLSIYNSYNNHSSQQCKNIKIEQPTIIVFINVSCVTCIDDLDFWLENSGKLQEKNIPMIFILRASDDFYFFKFLIENENKELPEGSFYLDIKDEFRVLNEQILTNGANTFLIDQELVIINSGNPVKSSSFAKSLFDEGF